MRLQRLLIVLCIVLPLIAFADPVSEGLTPDVITPRQQIPNAMSVEHWLWQKIPLSFPLTVGQERVIFFPGTQMAFDASGRSPMQLRVQSAGGAIYLKPQAPFPTTRMMAQDLTTGAVYFFDVSASTTPADNTPVQIVDEASVNSSASRATADTPNNTLSQPVLSNTTTSQVTNDYPSLVRYAVQELYAPLRLVVPRPDVRRTPMNTPVQVNLFVGKNGGGALSAQPLATWSDGTFFVTAVLIKNVTHQPRLLDPRTLLGMWVAVAFFPRSTVQPEGSRSDHTTVFLVSVQPFTQALGAVNDQLE